MIQSVLTFIGICAVAVAIVLCLVRIVRGPSAVDRAVANEVLVSTIVCAIGFEAAINRHSGTVPILVSLSLLGFLASVAIARFVARDHDSVQLGGDAGLVPESGPEGRR